LACRNTGFSLFLWDRLQSAPPPIRYEQGSSQFPLQSMVPQLPQAQPSNPEHPAQGSSQFPKQSEVPQTPQLRPSNGLHPAQESWQFPLQS
jgi:hypothetical protein